MYNAWPKKDNEKQLYITDAQHKQY